MTTPSDQHLKGEDAPICVGVIVGAHGLGGVVKIKSFTEQPENLAAFGELSDQAGKRRFRLNVVGQSKGSVLCRIDSVSDRTAAENLRGVRLFTSRAKLPPTADADEFYHVDLVGCTAAAPDGEELGRVVSVQDYGAGDVLEIQPHRSAATLLVPFTAELVPVVDLAGRRLTVIEPTTVDATAGADSDRADTQ